MDGVWVCQAAVTRDGLSIVTAHKRWAGEPGFEKFVACGFETSSFDEAARHAEERCHQLVEFPDGDENRKPLREMHDSDYGGVYVQTMEGGGS